MYNKVKVWDDYLRATEHTVQCVSVRLVHKEIKRRFRRRLSQLNQRAGTLNEGKYLRRSSCLHNLQRLDKDKKNI